MTQRARDIIDRLGLTPHPEGGYFGEVFRSDNQVTPGDDRLERPALTSIYFLLIDGEHSKWHFLRSDEIWHHIEGDPLELMVVNPIPMILSRKRLGPVAMGQAPIHPVAAGHWQAAMTLGEFTLVGCSVGPGFVFDDFAMLRHEPDASERLTEAFPNLRTFL